MRKGMTIVELVVVVVVLSIVMLFVTNFMIFQNRNITEQKAKIDTNKRVTKTYEYITSIFKEVGYCQNTSAGGFGIIDGVIGASTISPDTIHFPYTTDQDESGSMTDGDTIIVFFSGDTLYKHQNGNSSILVTDIDRLLFVYHYEDGTTSLAPAAGTYGSIKAIGILIKASCKYGNKTYEKEYTGGIYFRNVN
jgi:prepilin-type N-terminal cleavage/methylation domain-containing protein